MKNILVTGGAGFIGSHLVRLLVNKYPEYHIINMDLLTYAGNLDNLKDIQDKENYTFIKCNICDLENVKKVFIDHKIDSVIHLAAESHVDRSIEDPFSFAQTNVMGTLSLLQAAKAYWNGNFIDKLFYHVSTDEVYGSLGEEGFFTETTSYDPHSPYSASKAGSDHLVRAWGRTFGLPILVTNCSNNYGPCHFPEKLIPLIITNALQGKSLPVYGAGTQIRDWLYVDDHACALLAVLTRGEIGETYNIGGHCEKKNIDVVRAVCSLLDELSPTQLEGVDKYEELITFVADRPGHDLRYAIDATKIEEKLGWRPQETFDSGLRKTVQWYLRNESWWYRVLDGSYLREW